MQSFNETFVTGICFEIEYLLAVNGLSSCVGGNRARTVSDLARDVCRPPQGYDQDLSQMLKDLIGQGVPVEVCGTCMARCGIYKNHPYFEGANKSTMGFLADWVADSDKVLTF